jgi:hypothetical protein
MSPQHAGGVTSVDVTSVDTVTESGEEVGIGGEAVTEPVRRLPLFDAKVRGPFIHVSRPTTHRRPPVEIAPRSIRITRQHALYALTRTFCHASGSCGIRAAYFICRHHQSNGLRAISCEAEP